MHTIWRTGHSINERVTEALRKGTRFPVKNTALYNPDMPIKPAVGYGILRGTGQIFKDCAKAGVDYWEVDRGYFRPSHFDGYYRISLNGMHPKYRDIDLPGDRLEKLKINIAPWREGGTHIMVCPPTEAVCAFEGLNLEGRFAELVLPGMRELFKLPHDWFVREKSTDRPLQGDLESASAVVSYNSNVVVEALRQGVKAMAVEHPIAGWVHSKDYPDREKLFRFLSYCQFTLEEIESGMAWRIANEIQKESA